MYVNLPAALCLRQENKKLLSKGFETSVIGSFKFKVPGKRKRGKAPEKREEAERACRQRFFVAFCEQYYHFKQCYRY